MSTIEPPGIPHLAERLNALFHKVPRPGSSNAWSNDAVAEALTADGVSVTAPYLSQLRNGRRTNPSARLLHAISTFFGVPIDYFFQDHGHIDGQLDSLAMVRDSNLSVVLARTHGLSEQSRDELAAIIEAALRLEGGGAGAQSRNGHSPAPAHDEAGTESGSEARPA